MRGTSTPPILYLSVPIPIVFQGKDDRSRLVEAGSAGKYILRLNPLSELTRTLRHTYVVDVRCFPDGAEKV